MYLRPVAPSMVPAWPGSCVPGSPQRGAAPVEAGQQTEALAVNMRPVVNTALVNTGRVTVVCITVVVVVVVVVVAPLGWLEPGAPPGHAIQLPVGALLLTHHPVTTSLIHCHWIP